MNDMQIIGLCISMFFIGCLFVCVLEFIICFFWEHNEKKELIINYLKNNNNYNVPYMLVYKNLTFDEKQKILRKVGNK